ncbi:MULTISPECIES: hypothetical protein [Achromobacter]|uniref:Uncharacterized protein n=1 Tax=Alcaligenes xylosoxydans xylosoxydans TaxID=85698 RepID=A0A424WBL0_ALCXX|nr:MULTISPECIES: hypothetical protein [Achromobacter]MBC9906733.1 hypothetical protein [Achromobacter xylosoxidans]MBD0870287.1 hypothetical protein [Achromobacter xylosoxidans]MDH1299656.1 hypothetical protein [Achromobacter sp. GD03932]QNP83647.1 hypothetical protein IAG39_19000 [Achromobacter xylosoxidans]RPJ90723.1 hypothetical protein DY367_16310 [Achromobacter xylosoxidans]
MKPLDLDQVPPGAAGVPGIPIVGWLLDGPQPEFTDIVSVARQWMADGQRVSEVVRAQDCRGAPATGPGLILMRACGLAGKRSGAERKQ